MSSGSLLLPGSHRAAGLGDDSTLVRAMLRVETAWVRALATVGACEPDDAATVAGIAADLPVDLDALAEAAEASGNPVVPLVASLRRAMPDERVRDLVHRGLTSQDVLDTALVLLAREALSRVGADLAALCAHLSDLSGAHRDSVMVGRTLTQTAVPVTFGLKAAQWLSGVLDAGDAIDGVLHDLPVQCGGAAGTLALTTEVAGDAPVVARAFAAELGLGWRGVPWHTNRSPMTRIGAALVECCDALGTLACDVALLSRPEVAELREGPVPGRGGSSTMPHKRNPVLSVLVRSAALQAPQLGAQLHLAAAQAVDERPDGAWHSEWPALRRLLVLAVTAASQAAELVAGLEVDADVMRRRAEAAGSELLAERDGAADRAGAAVGDAGADVTGYLGATGSIIDAVLARARQRARKEKEEA